MTSRTIVVRQVDGLCAVVFFKTTDELNRGAIEAVDVLVIVADSEQAEFVVFLCQRSTGEGGDQVVLIPFDVLVFIDQNPAESCEQA